MDYKQIDKYANFGNFNYGAVGRALGIPSIVLKYGAGWAQSWADGLSHSQTIARSLRDPLNKGDNPGDQDLIKQGINSIPDSGFTDFDFGFIDYFKGIVLDGVRKGLISPWSPDADPFTGLPWPGSDSGGNSPSPSPEPGDPMPRPDPNGPSDDSWRYGDEGTVPPRRDPLVLALDGDGIETTSPRTGTVILRLLHLRRHTRGGAHCAAGCLGRQRDRHSRSWHKARMSQSTTAIRTPAPSGSPRQGIPLCACTACSDSDLRLLDHGAMASAAPCSHHPALTGVLNTIPSYMYERAVQVYFAFFKNNIQPTDWHIHIFYFNNFAIIFNISPRN